MCIRLSADEASGVLDEFHTGTLTTLRAGGWPISLPICLFALDKTICFTVSPKPKKVARIRRDSRGSFLVESGRHYVEPSAVRPMDRIAVVEDDARKGQIDDPIQAKYGAYRLSAQDELMPFALALTRAIATRSASAKQRGLHGLHGQGQSLDLDAALALEATAVAGRPDWNAAAFCSSWQGSRWPPAAVDNPGHGSKSPESLLFT